MKCTLVCVVCVIKIRDPSLLPLEEPKKSCCRKIYVSENTINNSFIAILVPSFE